MNKLDATLVILTRNEISGLKALFNKIPVNSVKEAFAIDYNSTDGTLDFFKKSILKLYISKKRKG